VQVVVKEVQEIQGPIQTQLLVDLVVVEEEIVVLQEREIHLL
jgi:hypothetical protein